MRSLIKPPCLSKLFIWFFKYDKKVVVTKIWFLKINQLLAFEKLTIYLLTYKNTYKSILKNLFLKFENYFFQNFQFSLVLKSTQKNFWLKKTSFSMAMQTAFEISRFFFWKDFFTKFHITFFSLIDINLKISQNKFSFLKDMIFNWEKAFFKKNFVLIKDINSIFFLNIFFFLFFFKFSNHKELSKKIKNWRKIYYFGLEFSKFFFFTKYDELFTEYNWLLTIQTGYLKRSNFYLDRNYIFSTSAQLAWAKKIFFFKFFFKNLKFRFILKEKVKKKLTKKNFFSDGIYTWSRSTEILPFLINKIIYIYNGQLFTWIWIRPGMVGYKLGQFSFTRKIHIWNMNFKNLFKNIAQ